MNISPGWLPWELGGHQVGLGGHQVPTRGAGRREQRAGSSWAHEGHRAATASRPAEQVQGPEHGTVGRTSPAYLGLSKRCRLSQSQQAPTQLTRSLTRKAGGNSV